MTDFAKLRELAEAASPGPWEVTETPGFGHDHAPYTVVDDRDEQVADCWDNTPGNRKPERNEANAAFIAAASPSTVIALLDEIERLNSLLTGRAARDASYAEADFEAVAENIAADPRWANRADSQRVARWALRQRRALAATQAALDEVTAARDELATMLEPIANYEMSGTARRETLDRISQLRTAGRAK